jgi:nitrogen regulatory protein PII-like uncharacterized protein
MSEGPAFPLDQLDIEQLAAMSGIAYATLNNNEDLMSALMDIQDKASRGITVTDRDIQMAIANTEWYRNHLNAYKEAERARAEYTPELFDDLMNRKAEDIVEQYEDNGAVIDMATARKYAEQMFYGSGRNEAGELEFFNDEWLGEQLAQAIDFSKTKTINGIEMYDLEGMAAENAQTLYEFAYDYGVDSSMSNDTFNSWFQKSLRGVMDGSLDETDIEGEMRDMALSRFPGLAPQLQRGLSVREAADPYLKAVQDELELADVGLDDNLVQAILNNVDGDGNHKPVSLYDARLRARRDPRWQRTYQAKQEYTDIASQIAKDFGFLG